VNRDGLVQVSERALATRGDAQPGWMLLAKLGRALGHALPWKKLSDVRRAMAGESSKGDGKDAGATPAPSAVAARTEAP